MLHASARDTLDFGKVALVLLKSLQNQVHCVEPHGYRCVDLALSRVGENTLLDAILFLEIIVKGDLGLVVKFEGGINDNS